MKLEKVTNRWYDDACGTALALELIGERWALLVVRELMFGPRRFGELRAGLPGISANVLTQRLGGLEAAGVVQRRKLPPPASVQVYELTPWGYESEIIIQTMGRWAARSPDHDPTLPLSAASMMLSFRTMLDRELAKGVDATIGFRFGEESFVARLDADGIAIRRGETVDADLMFTTDPMTLAAHVYGGAALDAAAVSGDRALAARFVTLFQLPAKADPSIPRQPESPT